MTTIAYRNGVLAADTAMCRGDAKYADAIVKIAKLPDGRLAAAVGSAGYCGEWLRWCQDGGEEAKRPTPKEGEGFFDTGLIVELSGELLIFEPTGWFRCHPEYYALGSGREFAIGAMAAGAGPEAAVRVAVKHDQGSGGSVMAFALNQPEPVA